MGEIASKNLTEKQQAFVSAIIEVGDHIRAADLAGYHFPRVDAARLLALPHVQRAIAAGAHRRLIEGVPMALKLLGDVIKDAAVSPRVRVDAAKAWLDRAGFVPPKAMEQAGLDKDLTSMDKDELRRFIAAAEERLANEAIDITPEHSPEDDPLFA